MKKYKKLVLFDIDGTLLSSVVPGGTLARFGYAIETVHGIKVEVHAENWKYNGVVDSGIVWDLIKDKGISRKEHKQKLGDVSHQFAVFLENLSAGGQIYAPIPDAVALVKKLSRQKNIALGVITGNLGETAAWKLRHIGLEKYFRFGLFGHEAESREELAQLISVRAKEFFHFEFPPKDIVIIGDTVHDIRCGKTIGATTIAVTTGWQIDRQTLMTEHPDILVDSLLAKPVRDFFSV